MDPTPERLKRRRDFLSVARTGRKWVAPGLILQIRPHMEVSGATRRRGNGTNGGVAGPPESDGGTLRVGFTVSRKVGGAVVRNRARRRLRAAVQAVMPGHAAPGHDYVVIGRRATVARRFTALRDDLEMALRRLGAWHQVGEQGGTGTNEGP